MLNQRDITTKILVVDDEKLIRLTVSAKLKSVGYSPIAVGTVEEALAIIKTEHSDLRAIITDIMMGDMDGFNFRDLVRGYDHNLPIFFMTALDPEEGSGFLKRIMDDANSYYLPKAVKAQVLLRRIQSIVASRRVERFIESQMEEQKTSLKLAAHVQQSMLPARVVTTPRGFYTSLWKPKEMVSGDLYEAMQFGTGVYLYVLGDIQGHGTSAALAMTAIQSFLKQFKVNDGQCNLGPADIANKLQWFFRNHLADVTYMTALICIHRPLSGEVAWLSCGAPDLRVLDLESESYMDINPEKRGALPIGLMPDTVYSKDDVVLTQLGDTSVCVAYSDGILDIARDPKNIDQLPREKIEDAIRELTVDARRNGSIVAVPQKLVTAFESLGYRFYADDVTILMFGKRVQPEGIYEQTVPMTPEAIADEAVAIEAWGSSQGWSDDLINRIQLVMEEVLMNVYDHGLDVRERQNMVANLRLRRVRNYVELTVWDCGTPTPSVAVATGDTNVAFELKNREFSVRGRGRLITRELCDGISRNRYDILNETIYFIPIEYRGKGEK